MELDNLISTFNSQEEIAEVKCKIRSKVRKQNAESQEYIDKLKKMLDDFLPLIKVKSLSKKLNKKYL